MKIEEDNNNENSSCNDCLSLSSSQSSWPSNETEISETKSMKSDEIEFSSYDSDRPRQDVSLHFKVVTILLVPLICCCLLCCIFCAQSRDWIRSCLGLQYVYRETYPLPPPQPAGSSFNQLPIASDLIKVSSREEVLIPRMTQKHENIQSSSNQISYGSMNSPIDDIVIMEIKEPS